MISVKISGLDGLVEQLLEKLRDRAMQLLLGRAPDPAPSADADAAPAPADPAAPGRVQGAPGGGA